MTELREECIENHENDEMCGEMIPTIWRKTLERIETKTREINGTRLANFGEYFWVRNGAEVCNVCRFRNILQHEYLIAKNRLRQRRTDRPKFQGDLNFKGLLAFRWSFSSSSNWPAPCCQAGRGRMLQCRRGSRRNRHHLYHLRARRPQILVRARTNIHAEIAHCCSKKKLVWD